MVLYDEQEVLRMDNRIILLTETLNLLWTLLCVMFLLHGAVWRLFFGDEKSLILSLILALDTGKKSSVEFIRGNYPINL